jgi:hypothetical protein
VNGISQETNGMDQWEYKVLHGLSEDELNRWGEQGYEIFSVIPPPPPPPGRYDPPEHRDRETTVILKRPKQS